MSDKEKKEEKLVPDTKVNTPQSIFEVKDDTKGNKLK